MTELGAPKTYKLYSGGAFIRSESGRVYPVAGSDGATVRVAQASRKDLRDAVVKARAAQSAWAGSTAYLRGQILGHEDLLRLNERLAGAGPNQIARSVATVSVPAIETHLAILGRLRGVA